MAKWARIISLIECVLIKKFVAHFTHLFAPVLFFQLCMDLPLTLLLLKLKLMNSYYTNL